MTFRFTWNCWIIKHLLYCRLVAMWMPKWITFSWSNRLVGWLAGWLKCAHCHSLNRIFIKCMYIYIYNVCVCVYLNIELMRFQTTHLCWIWNAISFNAINRIIAFNGPKYFVVMTSARTHARTHTINRIWCICQSKIVYHQQSLWDFSSVLGETEHHLFIVYLEYPNDIVCSQVNWYEQKCTSAMSI